MSWSVFYEKQQFVATRVCYFQSSFFMFKFTPSLVRCKMTGTIRSIITTSFSTNVRTTAWRHRSVLIKEKYVISVVSIDRCRCVMAFDDVTVLRHSREASQSPWLSRLLVIVISRFSPSLSSCVGLLLLLLGFWFRLSDRRSYWTELSRDECALSSLFVWT